MYIYMLVCVSILILNIYTYAIENLMPERMLDRMPGRMSE